jgi:hypothetical protein
MLSMCSLFQLRWCCEFRVGVGVGRCCFRLRMLLKLAVVHYILLPKSKAAIQCFLASLDLLASKGGYAKEQ